MDRIAHTLARLSALMGGLVLAALIGMTCVSITGRALAGAGLGPVPGDFELLEAGIAFAVFAFLPWCSLKAGHATVDIFTNGLSQQANRVLLAFWEVVMAITAAFIAWRLYEGAIGKLRNGETTFILQFPVWWAYAASLLPAGVAVLVALWSAWDRLRAVVSGRDTRAVKAEGGH
jgi:TRAP-type C4-dicarboxylate transport system permease small subunit